MLPRVKVINRRKQLLRFSRRARVVALGKREEGAGGTRGTIKASWLAASLTCLSTPKRERTETRQQAFSRPQLLPPLIPPPPDTFFRYSAVITPPKRRARDGEQGKEKGGRCTRFRFKPDEQSWHSSCLRPIAIEKILPLDRDADPTLSPAPAPSTSVHHSSLLSVAPATLLPEMESSCCAPFAARCVVRINHQFFVSCTRSGTLHPPLRLSLPGG